MRCSNQSRITTRSKTRSGSMNLTTAATLIREQQAKLDMQEATICRMQEEMNIAKEIWRQQVGRSSSLRSDSDCIPTTRDDSHSLMNETAKIIADSSRIEKEAPICDAVDEDAWNCFALKYSVYLTKGGKKPLKDLITLNVMNYYKRRLPNHNLQLMPSVNLFDLISDLNKSILDPLSILDTKLSMESITTLRKKSSRIHFFFY